LWKEILVGTDIAIGLLVKVGLYMMVVVSYLGGLISTDKVWAGVGMSEINLLVLQVAGALSALTFLGVLFWILLFFEVKPIEWLVGRKRVLK